MTRTQPQEQDITIVRASRDDPCFILRRATPQDEKLTWEARGMLVYFLSKPDDWKVKPHDLQQHCGRDKVYSILRELVVARYIDREKILDDKARIIKWLYRVYESPLPENPEVGNDDPLPEMPEEAPLPENPEVGNDDLADRLESLDVAPLSGLFVALLQAGELPSRVRARGIVNLNTGGEESLKPILSTQDRDKDSGLSSNELKRGATSPKRASKPRARKVSLPRGESGSAKTESGESNGSESTTPPTPQSPAPPKRPAKAHSRFTGSKWYAVNEAKCFVGHKSYTKAEADEAAQRLAAHGYTMIKGGLLNADLKYKTYKVIGGSLDTNGTSPAWKAFEESAPLMGDGVRIGLLLEALAQRENMLLSDLKASAEMALKIRAVYKMCADETPPMHPPTGVDAFIRQWNRKHHPVSFKQKADPSYRLTMVPLPDNRSAIRAGDAESQNEAS